jgi:hypothetical protein
MAASVRAITDGSPDPPANHDCWLMSQPDREGLPGGGGEAGPGAAAGGLLGVAGGRKVPCPTLEGWIVLDPENPHQGIHSGELPEKQRHNPLNAIYLNNRLNMSN